MNKTEPHHLKNKRIRKKCLDIKPNGSDIYNRCLRGDQEAWTTLYKIIYNNIGKFTYGNSIYKLDSIEDMAQDIVCFLLAGGIDKVREPVKFFGFVKKVTRNRILDKLRKKFQTPIPIGADIDNEKPGWDPPSPYPGPEARALGNIFSDNITKGISKLSVKCHVPVTEYLAYKKDGKYSSYTHLAETLNMKLGTLSSRITRCLEELSHLPYIRPWLEA